MATFPQDLRTFLIADSGITNLVSTRVHYNMVPQFTTRPLIWFRVVVDDEELTMDGAGGMHEAAVDIEAVAPSEADSQAISDAVKSRLHGHSGAFASHTSHGFFLQSKSDEYLPHTLVDGDDGRHVVATELRCWYTT